MPSMTVRRFSAAIVVFACGSAMAQGDVFSSRGAPSRPAQGDVFNSNGNPYGGPHPSRPTGKQATQDDSVYCQQTPDGRVIPKPYGGTRRNIPCGLPGTATARVAPTPAPQPKPQPPTPIPVFNFYYVNGINTPEHDDAVKTGARPVNRGSYDWDRQLVAGNLLGLGPPVNVAGAAKGFKDGDPAIARQIRVVANERNVFKDRTYNYSGLQPQNLSNCHSDRHNWYDENLCKAIRDYNNWRATSVANMAGGDIAECFLQSIGRGNDGNFAADNDAVAGWIDKIIQIYNNEDKGPNARIRNYFILIGHSQGNFFVEGMAYRLRAKTGSAGQRIFSTRLAVLSLASPTDYPSLKGGQAGRNDFLTSRLIHLTRKDDAIVGLHQANQSVFKTSFEGALPALWPYKEGMLKKLLTIVPSVELDPSTLLKIGVPLFNTMTLSPNDPNCVPAGKPSCNDALYTPLINSHLSDNYLTDPTLTRPGRPISQQAIKYLDMTQIFKPPPPVLNNLRAAIRTLKQDLLANDQ